MMWIYVIQMFSHMGTDLQMNYNQSIKQSSTLFIQQQKSADLSYDKSLSCHWWWKDWSLVGINLKQITLWVGSYLPLPWLSKKLALMLCLSKSPFLFLVSIWLLAQTSFLPFHCTALLFSLVSYLKVRLMVAHVILFWCWSWGWQPCAADLKLVIVV